jgi:hypothetical protein
MSNKIHSTILIVIAATAAFGTLCGSQPSLSQLKMRSLSGKVETRAAGSNWAAARESAELDPGTELRIGDGAVASAASGRSVDWFWFGPGEGAIGARSRNRTTTDAVDLDLKKGLVAVEFQSAAADAKYLIGLPEGTVEFGAGLYAVGVEPGRRSRIAAAEGRACLKRPQSKQLCADQNKMLVLDADTGKAPKIVAVDQDIRDAWKNSDWLVGGEKPALKVIQPQEGASFTDPNISIAGSASGDATVTVNNKEMEVNRSGDFSGSVSLYEGRNKLVVQARSRTGKTTTITRTVVLDTTSPLLNVSQPIDNFDPSTVGTCDDRNCYIQIFGITEPGARLNVNDANVSRFIEDDGSFFIQDFPIRRTTHTLRIEAVDAHQRRTFKILNISEPRDSDNDDYPDNFDACPLDPDCH